MRSQRLIALGLVRRETVKTVAQRLLMGPRAGRAAVARIAAAFAVREAVRSGALAQIAADRADGLTIVMATASFDFYARAIAARLGIEHVVATRSVWAGDWLRPGIDGDNCYGAAKLAMLDAAFPGAVARPRLFGPCLRRAAACARGRRGRGQPVAEAARAGDGAGMADRRLGLNRNGRSRSPARRRHSRSLRRWRSRSGGGASRCRRSRSRRSSSPTSPVRGRSSRCCWC